MILKLESELEFRTTQALMNRIKKGNKTVTTYRHRVQFVAVVVPPSLLCCSSHARHTPLAPKASWHYFTRMLAANMPTGITDHDVRTHFGLHWCLRLSISSSPRMLRCSAMTLRMLRTASWVVRFPTIRIVEDRIKAVYIFDGEGSEMRTQWRRVSHVSLD